MTGERPGDEPPAAARSRLAEIAASGTWGSALSAEEFAAIKSTGFEPAGQVLGAAVYNIGYTGGYGCPGAWAGYGGLVAPTGVTTVSGAGSYGTFGPMVATLYEARRMALSRMEAECQDLGGHGVVGVQLTIGPFPAGGLEFKAIGTAIRGPGAPPLERPFTSALTGQDFAKLVLAGWVPTGLVLGISIGSRHDDWLTVTQTRWRSGNAEVHGYADLVSQTRHDARLQLEKDVAARGAAGVVVQDMTLRVSERECPVQEGRRDHIVEATIIGTSIARFVTKRDRPPAPPLAIMSLDPKRRQVARVRL
ncbi:MAG: heavy metal-binding domain-containing protein [Streptosporangiaceae bacterium]